MNQVNEILEDINKEISYMPVNIKNKIIQNIPIDKIDILTERENIGNLDILKASIKKYGLINPVTVLKAGDRYKKIAGYRRIKAMQELGETTVPAIVIETNEIKETELYFLTFYENTARKNLNVVEKTNLFLISLYEFADKVAFSKKGFAVNKAVEQLKNKIPNFEEINEREKVFLIARKIFAYFYGLERRNIKNLTPVEVKIKEKWIFFREQFGFYNIETIRKYVKISTLSEPLISLLKDEIINKEYALKAVNVSVYPNTYNKLVLRINGLLREFKAEEIDFENFSKKTKELIDYYFQRKDIENIDNNEDLIKKNAELLDELKIIQNTVRKKIKRELFKKEKIEKIEQYLQKIDLILNGEEEI